MRFPREAILAFTFTAHRKFGKLPGFHSEKDLGHSWWSQEECMTGLIDLIIARILNLNELYHKLDLKGNYVADNFAQ